MATLTVFFEFDHRSDQLVASELIVFWEEIYTFNETVVSVSAAETFMRLTLPIQNLVGGWFQSQTHQAVVAPARECR